jgi:tetratricopeptide (TPR) repeat protein
MSKPRIWTILNALLAIIVLSLAACAQDQREQAKDAGFISEVKGTCWLQRGTSSVQITLRKFGGAGLRVGDKLRCDKDGSLVVELRSLRTTIEPSDRWTTIPRASGSRKDAMAGPVDDWFKLAGAVRGLPGGVYSPPSGGYGSAVWPDHFVIRWVPRKRAQDLWLKIRDQSGTQLWPQDNEQGIKVPSTAGELISNEARQALSKYRQTGSREPLTLVVVDSKGNEGDIEFSIVSEQDEETLKKELRVCSDQPGVMAYICRAYYLRQLKLYAEAADEYEAALKLAPDSVDLQLHAIAAHRFTGNYAREQELVGRLPSGTTPPE